MVGPSAFTEGVIKALHPISELKPNPRSCTPDGDPKSQPYTHRHENYCIRFEHHFAGPGRTSRYPKWYTCWFPFWEPAFGPPIKIAKGTPKLAPKMRTEKGTHFGYQSSAPGYEIGAQSGGPKGNSSDTRNRLMGSCFGYTWSEYSTHIK